MAALSETFQVRRSSGAHTAVLGRCLRLPKFTAAKSLLSSAEKNVGGSPTRMCDKNDEKMNDPKSIQNHFRDVPGPPGHQKT